MSYVKPFVNIWMLVILLLPLAACGDSGTTATPTLNPTTAPAPNPTTTTAAPTAILATNTALPLPSPTSAATATVAPATPATSAPTPTQTPSRPVARQIGAPGCCLDFRFAADGRFYYYDKPANAPRPAVYIFNLQNGTAQPLYSRQGNFSRDLSLVSVSDRAANVTTIEQVSDGKKLATLQNRASPTLISPDNSKVAYLLRALQQEGPEQPQIFELLEGNADGSQLKSIWNLREGDNLAWFPDNRRLLLTARDAANQRFGLWVVDTQAAPNQGATLIVESKGLIAARLSPDGTRVVYAITLQGGNSGVWLANADGSNRRKFDWVGSWRWADGDKNELFYIPSRSSGETSSSLWSYDLNSGQALKLTSPDITPLSISNDEWQVSPDGKGIAFRAGQDRSLWWLSFRS